MECVASGSETCHMFATFSPVKERSLFWLSLHTSSLSPLRRRLRIQSGAKAGSQL